MPTAPRTVDPGHVTYRWYPNLDRPEWGLQATGAYWIGDVAARQSGPRSWARIDARSRARRDPATTPVRGHGVLVGRRSSPATVSELTWSLGAAPPRQASIALDLTNVAAFSLNLTRAGLARGEAATLALRSDGEAAITLTGARPGTTIRLDRAAMGNAGPDGRFTVRIPPGRHEVALRPSTDPQEAAH
jgi:hypothetical protein